MKIKMTLTNKSEYELTQNEADQIMQLIERNSKFIRLRGDMIMTSAIVAIQQIENPFEKARRNQYFLDTNSLPEIKPAPEVEEVAQAKAKLIQKLSTGK